MYSSLATKYRPRKFKQVIGQPDVPIIRAVTNDPTALPPLLLLCGPSGIGKTTIARIIAAAVNCVDLDSTGEPCGVCDTCVAIRNDTYPNVYEMDAASHGTADHLRDVVVKCHLSSNGVKLFILDEAQSISGQGWNILLKVLEEPPPDCMFILLTSEPKKVPSKIRTRALRFNLRPVTPTKLHRYISQLSKHSNIGVTDDDIDILTNMSEGSVRDALMMLEQCHASGLSAQELFGDRDLSLDYFLSIVNKDYLGALEIVKSWWSEVGDAKTILSQLAISAEKLTLTKNNIECYKGSSDTKKYQTLVDSLSTESIVAILTVISDWFSQSYSKAQIVMLTSKLYRSVNGAPVLETKTVVELGLFLGQIKIHFQTPQAQELRYPCLARPRKVTFGLGNILMLCWFFHRNEVADTVYRYAMEECRIKEQRPSLIYRLYLLMGFLLFSFEFRL